MFHMLIGLPASGKSEWAKNQGSIVHSSDSVRKAMFGAEGYSKEEQAAVFAEVHKRIITDLEHQKDVIFDATNLNRKKRMEFMKKIEHIHTEKIAVLFLGSVANLKKRNNAREATVPEYVYDKMLRQFDPPMLFEGFDKVIVINNCDDQDVEKIDYHDFKKIPHDSKYHTETIGDHMEETEHIVMQLTDDMCVIRAALFHDFGKPFVKSFTDKNGEATKYAKYYCHEHVGSYVWLNTYANDKTITVYAALRIANLIDMHMRPFVWEKSRKAMMNDLDMIGRSEFNNLLIIHAADCAASKAAL